MTKQTTLDAMRDSVTQTMANTAPASEPVESSTPVTQPAAPEPVSTTPEPVAPVEPAAPAEPTTVTTSPTYLDRVKELGFENVTTEEEAFQRLLDAHRVQQEEAQRWQQQWNQAQPYLQYGQEYLNQLQASQLQGSQQPAAPAKPEEKPDPTKWWNPPAYDPAVAEKYRDVVIDPATGDRKVEWKANTPASVRTAYEANQTYREQWADKLVNNPREALAGFRDEIRAEMKAEFEKYLTEQVATRDSQYEVNRFAERIKEENEDWMFERDPRTNGVRVDPFTRQPVWTDAGKMAMQLIGNAEQIGIKDPQHQWNYALAMLNSYQQQLAQQQQPLTAPVTQQQAPSAVTAEDKKQELLNRGRAAATGIPSRNGSEPPVEANPRRTRGQNKNLGAGAQLLADLKKNGHFVG